MDNFMFALEHSPTFPLDIDSLAIPDYVPKDRFSMTVVGTFADLGKLIEASQELQGILSRCAAWYESEPSAKAQLLNADVEVPLEPPIADWLTARNLAIPPTGIGWLGKESEAKDAVVRIGSSLCVHRLKPSSKKLSNGKNGGGFYYDAEYDVHHPLVVFFEEFGGEVLGEGDCGGHDGIVADLTCACSDLVGNYLERELAQYVNLYYYLYALPPWHPKGISPDQVRARETFNRLSNRAEAEHPDDHPIVARKLKQRSSFTSLSAWGIDIGFHVGQLQVVKQDEDWRVAPEEMPISTDIMEICFEDQILSLGWITFDSFIYGFPSIVNYLAKHGCTNFRYELVDFGQVRED
jgi:hypothetical protein